MCVGHFYLATLFLAMKEGSQGSLHVEKCLELRKTIFPLGHIKIGKGKNHVIYFIFIE